MDDAPDQQEDRLTWEALSPDVTPAPGDLDTLIELVIELGRAPKGGDLAERVIVF